MLEACRKSGHFAFFQLLKIANMRKKAVPFLLFLKDCKPQIPTLCCFAYFD